MKRKRAQSVDHRPDAKAIARFMRFVDMRSLPGCWLWTGTRCSRKGHGQFWWNGRMHWAHRISYLIFNGPLNDSQDVAHLIVPGMAEPIANNVNPDFLELQDVSDNVAECNRRRSRQAVDSDEEIPI